ncbi:MAG: Gfo/Idh/MocA family oxidoreductase [Oscillospiraceae bacterium]|nr:Gfo/Idh/MocA family oxidoreductase [Oscillospiraceae bacterium]
MSKLKIAIIGCGNIANSAHIPSYLQLPGECEIKYFCDIIKEKAERCVKKYGCGIAIEDYRDAVNDPEVDALSVCTHNLMHKQISIEALRAGKHVLCEKPAARIYSEALETKQQAMSREWHIKRLSHGEKEELLKKADLFLFDEAQAQIEEYLGKA